MALAPVDFLARVDASHASLVAGLDALAVQNGGGGRWRTPAQHPQEFAELMIKLLPQARAHPLPEVIVNGGPGGKVLGQQAPGATAPNNIKNGVQNHAPGMRGGSATGLGLGHMRFNPFPFLISQISRISWYILHPTTCQIRQAGGFPNTLLVIFAVNHLSRF